MVYEEALAYLEELSVFGVRLGLSRIEKLLALLGMPQNQYRSVHVTGTNGKGSVSAMLEEILLASSIRTGLYTSPHLVSYTERIRVDGKPVSEVEFGDCMGKVKACVDRMVADGEESPTQFEVLTAAAFFCFAAHHVEYAVVEVGLGGLLDSTNVIHPEVSVITNVSFEHAAQCGGTLEGIAYHKAGIIKEGVPVVTAAKWFPLEIIRQEARARNAKLHVFGKDFQSRVTSFDTHGQRLEFTAPSLGIGAESYELRLLGEHQAQNCALALMAAGLLRLQEKRITLEAAQKALKTVAWPGRFELVRLGEQDVLLDGAHNPAGIHALRNGLDQYFPKEPRTFLLGILRDKDMDTMLETLLREEDAVVVTEPISGRAAPADEVASLARQRSRNVAVRENADKALSLALKQAEGKRLLVVSGSLYLIGYIRARLMEKLRERGMPLEH